MSSRVVEFDTVGSRSGYRDTSMCSKKNMNGGDMGGGEG